MDAKKIAVFWFRRDLRLEDNVGLYEALKNESQVLPIFIFDTSILQKLPLNDARVNFIHQTLQKLQQNLASHQKGIAIYQGEPEDIFQKLLSQYQINAVYTNRDYEPYAIKRDQKIKEFLNQKGIAFKSFKDQVIFEKNEVIKADGSPYVVYTPYMKKWREHFKTLSLAEVNNFQYLNRLVDSNELPNKSLSEIGFSVSTIQVPSYNTASDLIRDYEATRNFPAINGTSKLGAHLRFGTVSIRSIILEIIEEKNDTFLKELIWREFFMQILWHFPYTVNKSFKAKYDGIRWRNNEQEFDLWCQGKTGYPLVDAGMRELNNTGFMHNRVRMLTASFLCKHLLIDWRWGEAYFAEKLLDYEQSSNIGNWQWVAGCGVDAAPYFRIFNPTTQIQKFDKDHHYINKWVKDLNELSYPQQIVPHSFARERCLKTYKEVLS